MLTVAGYEASEDKAYKEPLLTDPDEPPPVPVMLAEPAPAAPITLECSEPAYTEYPEPGPPGQTGGLVSDWLFVRGGCGPVPLSHCRLVEVRHVHTMFVHFSIHTIKNQALTDDVTWSTVWLGLHPKGSWALITFREFGCWMEEKKMWENIFSITKKTSGEFTSGATGIYTTHFLIISSMEKCSRI